MYKFIFNSIAVIASTYNWLAIRLFGCTEMKLIGDEYSNR